MRIDGDVEQTIELSLDEISGVRTDVVSDLHLRDHVRRPGATLVGEALSLALGKT